MRAVWTVLCGFAFFFTRIGYVIRNEINGGGHGVFVFAVVWVLFTVVSKNKYLAYLYTIPSKEKKL